MKHRELDTSAFAWCKGADEINEIRFKSKKGTDWTPVYYMLMFTSGVAITMSILMIMDLMSM